MAWCRCVRRRHICLATLALVLLLSRIDQVRQHAETQQAAALRAQLPGGQAILSDSKVAPRVPLQRTTARPPVCLKPIAGHRAACSSDLPLWPAVRKAAVPCTSARSADSSPVATARLCASLLESLQLDPSTRVAVLPQLQLLGTGIRRTFKGIVSPVNGSHCRLWTYVARNDASTEPWLPHLSVAEQSLREAYNLSIVAAAPGGAAQITIHSNTILGLRHGLRTLAALVSSAASALVTSSGDGGVTLPVLSIYDRPRFGYRGLILDTAHHFLSVDGLLATITLLGRLKYNVLHWHLTDTQSFQLVLPAHPELAQASAKPSERYSLGDLHTVVTAARLEGLSVLLEIETPGHASSWHQSHPELSIVGPTGDVAAHVSPSGESYTKCPEGKGNLDPTNEVRLHTTAVCIL